MAFNNVFKGSLVILFSFCFSIMALTVKVVQPDGTPLPGVTVSFKKLTTKFTTDATGEIAVPVQVKNCQGVFTEKSLRINSKSMSLLLPVPQNVDIRIFSLNGTLIYKYKARHQSGIVTISVPHLPAGLCLLSANLGSQTIRQKFLPSEGFSFSQNTASTTTSKNRYSAVLVKSQQVIDTASFTMTGKVTVKKTISDYNENLGTIVLEPERNYGNWFGFEKCAVDTVNPNFVHVLFRAYDENGYGRTSFATSRIKCVEDGQSITSESNFIIQKADMFSYDIKTVLYFNLSPSSRDSVSKIREAAKVMVRAIRPYQQIAILGFSTSPGVIQDFTADTARLIAAIDKIAPDSGSTGVDSTRLYWSISAGLYRIKNSVDIKNLKITFGNVVVFTDGRVNDGRMTLEELLADKGNKQVYIIELGKGNNIPELKKISGGLTFLAGTTAALSYIFESIEKEIVATVSSFWWAHYRSPARGNQSHTIQLTCNGNTNTDSTNGISGLFQSNTFVDDWLPVADSLKVECNATKDTLIGSYNYTDKNGRTEGASVVEWYSSNGGTPVKIGTGQKLARAAVPTTGYVIFQVRPVALSGSASVGNLVSLSFSNVTVTQPLNGTIDWTPKKDFYINGDTILLSATPSIDCTFLNWTGTTSGNINPMKLEINSNAIISVNIAPPCTLTVNVTGGTVSKSPDKPYYIYGDVVTLTAVPNQKFLFEKWSGGISDTVNPIKLVMTKSMRIAAVMKTPMTGVAAVSAGVFYAMILKTDGTLWGTGLNKEGQLGDGTNTSRTTPVQVMTDVAAVSSGGYHTMILKTDGTLWATGDNGYGRLGDGTGRNKTTPVQIMTGVAAVSAGPLHTMILKTDSTLWGTGDNNYGELGDGTTGGFKTAPVQVMSSVVAVSAGYHHTMILKTGGTLWATGENKYGQLGDGTTTNQTIPVQVMTGVAAVWAGYSNTMILKTDGTLWATGSNSNGRLGNGATQYTSISTPVQVMAGVTSVSSGYEHTMILKTDGTLWGAGLNNAGELGDGIPRLTNTSTPFQIMTGVAAVSAGYFHTMILKTDGTPWAAGDNTNGQIGDGTTVNKTTFVPVYIMQ